MNLETWDVSADGSGRVLAWVEMGESDGLYHLYIAANGGINASDCRGMFALYPNLTQIVFNDAFHTEQAVDMDHMFYKCESLEMLHPGQQFITAEVTDMSGMFVDCASLSGLDFSGFSMESAESVERMFAGTSNFQPLEMMGANWYEVEHYEGFLPGSGWKWLFAPNAWEGSILKKGNGYTVPGSDYQVGGILSVKVVPMPARMPDDNWCDISEDGSGRVVAWVESADGGNNYKHLYLAGSGGINAKNCEYLRENYKNVQTIDLSGGFYTNYAENMDGTDWKVLFWEQNLLMRDDPWECMWDTEAIDWFSCYEAPILGNSNYKRNQIKTVTILDTLAGKPDNAWDVSVDGDGSVMAWVKANGNLYDLYIAGNGGVSAGMNCEGLFAGYKNVTGYSFGDAFHTDEVVYMEYMFMYNGNISKIDISHFDTERCETMDWMFFDCKELSELKADRELFQSDNLQSVSGMFKSSSISISDIDQIGWPKEDVEREDFMKGSGWKSKFKPVDD